MNRPRVILAVDPDTKQVIHGTLTVDHATGAIAMRIPHKLEGTNAGMWGGHWTKKHKASAEWETLIRIVMADYAQADTVAGFHPHYVRALGLLPVVGRREIGVVRIAPSRRNFIKDDDNRAMALKPIVDAIKRLGLIHQDSAKWTRLLPLEQELSEDGRWWTAVTITIPVGESLPLTAATAALTARSER